MKEIRARLMRLKPITSLMADQALMPVARAAECVRITEARAEELAKHRTDLMRASNDIHLAGAMLSQAERLRKLQSVALQDLAAARAAFDREKAKASRAFGQDLVVGRLLEQQDAADQLEQKRKKLR